MDKVQSLKILDSLMNMVNQHCSMKSCDGGNKVICPMAICSNEDAIDLLVELGYLEQIRPRREWYKWTEKCVDLYEQINGVAN